VVQAGTVYRHAVDVLRGAGEPLTAREIVVAVLVAAKVDSSKKAAVADLTGSILASLRNHVGKGRVSSGQRGQPGKVEIERGRQLRRL
jgi:hypothetical protein